MQPDIPEFLQTLDTEVTARGHLLDRVREEIKTFEAIRESLATLPVSAENSHSAGKIHDYLENLKLLEQKVRYTHLTLFNTHGNENEKEMNSRLIALLKKLSTV